MDVQAISQNNEFPGITNSQSQSVSNAFSKFLDEMDAAEKIKEMQEEILQKYNVRLHVMNYACSKTDQSAISYDSAMVESGIFHGNGNVVISKKTLLKMNRDIRFRNKVYKHLKDLNEWDITAGGFIKSTGVFIHEDGTPLYWIEFDWGDEDDEKEPKKIKQGKKIELFRYIDNSIANLDEQAALLGSLLVSPDMKNELLSKNKAEKQSIKK